MLFGLYRDHPSKSISLQRPSILFRPLMDNPNESPPSLFELRRTAFAPEKAVGVSQPKRLARRLVEPPGIAPGSDPPISARLSP